MGERKSRVLNEILSRWLKLWNRWRRKKLAAKAGVSGRLLKSGPLRRYFQHSGAEQNTDIIKKILAFLFSDST